MKKSILLLALLGLFCQQAKSETEPNDDATQANQILLNIGQSGSLLGTDVNDWFSLNVPEGGILTLTIIKTGGGNARLYLKDAETAGFPEITNFYTGFGDSPPAGWTMTYPLLPGNYYLHFERYDAPVDYTLTPTLSVSNYPQDLEPNNASVEAQTMPVNGSVSGTMRYYGAGEGVDMVDWFKMTVPQAGILHLTIHKKGPGNTWVRFLDGELGPLPEISNFYTGYGESPTEGWNWSYPVLAGTYYFKVSEGEYNLDYKLDASLTLPNYAEDNEPNNSYLEAQIMPVNGTVSGTLRYYGAGEGADLKDWFKLTVPQGGYLNFTIHKKGPGNTWMRLRDGEKTGQPEISNFYTGYGESPAEGWNWSFPALAGIYYLQIEDGEYNLDYQVDNALVPSPWGEDTEPNNDVATAQNFPLGDSIGGLLGYYDPGLGYDDWDWYKMTTTEDGLLSFNVNKIGNNNGNMRLRNETAEIATQYLPWGDNIVNFSKIVPVGNYYLGFEKYNGDLRYKVKSSLLPTPVAGFTYHQTGNVFTFENTTLHEATYLWKFDDGATATTVNAYHEYAEPGNFDVCLIATNPAGSDTSCQVVVMPGVARALPAEGGNTGDVTLQVFGGGLDTSYVAKIMNGGTVVATSNFTGFAGKSSIFVRFDLRDKPVGNYQLRIEAAGGPSYTVPGGFKIAQGIAADPWVSIGGRNRILFNTWTTYTVNYGNRGNVDARMAPIWLVFSKDPGLQVEFPNVHFNMPDTLVGEPETEGIYMETDSVFGQPFPARVYPLIMPVIPAGTEASFKIRVKTGGNLKIKAWAEQPWFQSPINEQKVGCFTEALSGAPADLSLTEDKVLCMQVLTAVIFEREDDLYARDIHEGRIKEAQRPPFATLLLRVVRATSKICGISSPDDRKRVSEWVTNIILNQWLSSQKTPALVGVSIEERSNESCSAEFEPRNPTTNTLTAVSSLDPNEKSGPAGFGTENYLRDTRSFPYTIHFENVDTASAPAHTVTVSDQLDLAKFDLNSFSFGNVFIGDSVLYVEPGLREFVLDKRMSNLGVTARVHGKLDMQTGLVTWTFRSLDATTLEDIEDPGIGFLPPNINRPEGEGAVSFFVKLKNAPQNNEQVQNSASIVFDANPAIATNEHLVTFDLIAPQSAIQPIDPVQSTAQFELSWSGNDAGSGLQHYNIYYILNGTDTVLWLGGTTETTAIFSGLGTGTYEFYSIAVDNVGNVEATPAHPDAVTTIVTATDEQFASKADLLLYPNPASDQLTIVNRSAEDGCLTLVQADGRVIAKLHLQGNDQQQFSVTNVPQGLLLWKWMPGCEGAMQTGRVLVVR
jgi:PKD repeat protein